MSSCANILKPNTFSFLGWHRKWIYFRDKELFRWNCGTFSNCQDEKVSKCFLMFKRIKKILIKGNVLGTYYTNDKWICRSGFTLPPAFSLSSFLLCILPFYVMWKKGNVNLWHSRLVLIHFYDFDFDVEMVDSFKTETALSCPHSMCMCACSETCTFCGAY